MRIRKFSPVAIAGVVTAAVVLTGIALAGFGSAAYAVDGEPGQSNVKPDQSTTQAQTKRQRVGRSWMLVRVVPEGMSTDYFDYTIRLHFEGVAYDLPDVSSGGLDRLIIRLPDDRLVVGMDWNNLSPPRPCRVRRATQRDFVLPGARIIDAKLAKLR